MTENSLRGTHPVTRANPIHAQLQSDKKMGHCGVGPAIELMSTRGEGCGAGCQALRWGGKVVGPGYDEEWV